MKSVTSLSIAALAAVGFSSASAKAALLADFNASSFNATADTLTDSVSGVVASATNGQTNVADPTTGSVITTGGGFLFNAISVPGLAGLTSYTTAGSFTYFGGAPGGAAAYQGSGVLGGDIGGFGQGDTILSVTADGNGQLIGGNGQGNGSDRNVYDVGGTPANPGHNNQFNANTGTFQANVRTGAVLVADGVAGTLSLYAFGSLVDQQPWVPTAFGLNNGAPSTVYNFGIGSNTNGNNGGANPLNGSITDIQIYGTALSPAAAAALSGQLSVPEPASLGLLGVGALAGLARRRSRTTTC